ncbi:MAG TPA: Mov34/MPN/PAD-1 family protein [Gaiellaceae bacterium]|nr:Mov34/MPN/PAD-1 family protein [Gaiellaceae bacterium]
MVVPAKVRAQIAEHARAEAPNESCGLLLLDGDRAVEYVPAINKAASPYRFELYLDPTRWSEIELEQAVVHSHLSSPPRPSRTDVENIGLWAGKPYLIYSVREDDLAAWLVTGGEIEPLALQVE